MGLYLKTLLFGLLNFSVVHGKNLCPASFCGSSMLSIQYPFKLDHQIPKNNCTYFNLTCSVTQSTAIVNIPFAGDFYVQDIDYTERYMELSDPGNCLTRRLMNFSLESSLFKAIYYVNYTFYVCPLGSQVLAYLVNPIGCLSNSTNITVATHEFSKEFMESYGCSGIGSWLIPVSRTEQFDDVGFNNDLFLFLTWDATVCKDCGESGDQESGKWGEKPIAKIVAIALSMPALIIMGLTCCSVFCLHVMGLIAQKHEAESAAAAPTTTMTPQTTISTTLPPPATARDTGLDEPKIMACTEIIVLGESDESITSANSSTCSICLENYCQIEEIRLISKCGHLFHASCIQEWLGKNGSCPVCRTSLSDVAL